MINITIWIMIGVMIIWRMMFLWRWW
jgi:hypothetical protein